MFTLGLVLALLVAPLTFVTSIVLMSKAGGRGVSRRVSHTLGITGVSLFFGTLIIGGIGGVLAIVGLVNILTGGGAL